MGYTLITGASAGIGKALANEFAKHKHDLILVARSEAKLNRLRAELKEEFKINVEVYAVDLSIEEARYELFAYTKHKGFEVDILVNNAGFGDANAYLNAEWERQKNMVDLNILALMHLAYLYGNEMKKKGSGKILNLSSVAAFSAGPYMSVYYASKGFVLSLSEALHEELKENGVTVSALCPGPTATDFEKNAKMISSKMFTKFGTETPEHVAKRGYNGLMHGKAVIYHGKVTFGFNLITRLFSRKFARKLAQKLN